jgi:hypothetical protein
LLTKTVKRLRIETNKPLTILFAADSYVVVTGTREGKGNRNREGFTVTPVNEVIEFGRI